MEKTEKSALRIEFSLRMMSNEEFTERRLIPGTEYVIRKHADFDAGQRRRDGISKWTAAFLALQIDPEGMTPKEATDATAQITAGLTDAMRYDRFTPGVPGLNLPGVRASNMGQMIPLIEKAGQAAIRLRKKGLEARLADPADLYDGERLKCAGEIGECDKALGIRPVIAPIRPVPGQSLTQQHRVSHLAPELPRPMPSRPPGYTTA